MNDTYDTNAILQILDSDGSGYIDKEKLQSTCPHLSPLEIDTIQGVPKVRIESFYG
jgi:hypothetical protein